MLPGHDFDIQAKPCLEVFFEASVYYRILYISRLLFQRAYHAFVDLQ